ncbi:MAG: hypothetical protein M3Q61_03420 [Chloroflexota bacterium]|nr:hypothetical protein [Chloroflexota bacterium]
MRRTSAGRMGGGAVVLLGYAGATGQLSIALSPVQWGWLAVTAVLLLAVLVFVAWPRRVRTREVDPAAA